MRMRAFFLGLAIGYRVGNFVAYWYLRARRRRTHAEGVRALGRMARVAGGG